MCIVTNVPVYNLQQAINQKVKSTMWTNYNWPGSSYYEKSDSVHGTWILNKECLIQKTYKQGPS